MPDTRQWFSVKRCQAMKPCYNCKRKIGPALSKRLNFMIRNSIQPPKVPKFDCDNLCGNEIH